MKPITAYLLAISAAFVSRAYAAETITNAATLAATLLENHPAPRKYTLDAKITFSRYSEGEDIALALEDDSGAVVVHDISRASEGMEPGDIVRVAGRTEIGKDKNCARVLKIAKIAAGTKPEPHKTSIKELLNGTFDWRLATVTGMVRDAFVSEVNPRWVILVVSSEGDNLYVSVPANDVPLESFESLVGAEVSMEGVCVPQDLSVRNYIGKIFKCAGRSALHVISSQSEDPYLVPDAANIRKLRPSQIATLGRHRAAGHVIAAWGGNNILLKTKGGKIVRVECTRKPLPAYGDCIEVAGFPETDLYHINLTRAIWHRIPPVPALEEQVRHVMAGEILSDGESPERKMVHFHGQLISLRGFVRSLPEAGKRADTIYLESDALIVPVDISTVPEAIDGLTAGAEVDVCGVCVLDIENWRPNLAFPRIKGFSVVVRKASDFAILSRPSWWTPGRLTAIIGTLLSALVGILIWNRSLRVLAERRSRELLREQVGNMKSKLQVLERTRLAVELHDSVAQSLTAVSLEVAAAKELNDKTPPDMMAHLNLAEKTLKSCRDELRNCLWDLRSQALEENDMNKAILRTLQPHIDGSRLSVSFNVPRSRLSDNTAHAILRIVRELVVNAIRHANANTIRVSGELDRNELVFSVGDDGCGFDPENCPGIANGHYGLQGIRERIDRLGGKFEIASAPGKGTKASAVIPTLVKE